MRSARSNTITEWPARLSCCATASPGTGTDHGHLLSRAHARRLGPHPALVERVIDDRDLDCLDRDAVVVAAEHARAVARGWTQSPGELGEVVGRVQPLDGVTPAVLVDEIVPVGDQVAERAALMTERNAAVHAPRALLSQIVDREGQVHLLPVAQA